MPTLRTRAAKGSELTHNELDANFTRPVTQKTTTYQVVVGDNRAVIEGNHATTPFTVTLPTVAAAGAAEPGDFEVTVNNIGAAVVSLDGSGVETINGSDTAIALPQYATITVKLNAGGTAWEVINHVGGDQTFNIATISTSATIGGNAVYGKVAGTPTATTSGTEQDYTGLPTTITSLDVMLNEVSLSGSTRLIIQLGDATTGGFITSGYISALSETAGGSPTAANVSGGIALQNSTGAAQKISGLVQIRLLDATNFIYVFSGLLCETSGPIIDVSGVITLAGKVDRVRLTGDGVETLDAGSFNILYG